MTLKDSFTITFTVYFKSNQDEEHEMPLCDKKNFYYDISDLDLLSFRNAVAVNRLHGEVDPVCLGSTPGVPSHNTEN
jgi:hypothetical protein